MQGSVKFVQEKLMIGLDTDRFALPKLKLSHNASCGAYRIAAWFFAGFEMNST